MTTAEPSVTDQIKAAIETWQVELESAAQFRAEYQPLFDKADRLEENVTLAKQAITELLVASGVDWAAHNGVEANLVRQDRGHYDPERLPQTDAVISACTLTIDKAAVKALVKAHQITHDEAAAAWVEKRTAPYAQLTVKAEVPHE